MNKTSSISRILNATKLDIYTSRSSMRTIVIMYVIPIVIGVAVKIPEFTLGLTMVLSVFAGGYVFSVQERNHSDKLYGILPLKKSEMIWGRYLYALLIGVVSSILAIVFTLVISRIVKVDIPIFNFLGVFALAFVYYFFDMGIAYPIYLKFTFSKAYIFTMLPMYLIFLAAMLIMKKSKNFAQNLSDFFSFFQDHLPLIPIFGIVLGLIFFVVSALIANLIYTRKEI